MNNTTSNERSTSKFIASMLILVYQVTGIIYLIKNYNITNTCITDHIWTYVLFSLIAALGQGVNINILQQNRGTFLLITLTNIALIIWGGAEVMNKSCISARNNHLWIFALVTFILQTVVGFMYIVIGCCALCFVIREWQHPIRNDYEEV